MTKKTPNTHQENLELIHSIPHHHIVKQIELKWGTIECEKYINSLLIMERDRAGFSMTTSQTLFSLLPLNDQAIQEKQKS